MLVPLSFLDDASQRQESSLGEVISGHLAGSSTATLLDCLCSGSAPAIFSPEISRSSLSHDDLKSFILNFSLPLSSTRPKLGRNDRIMVVLPSGPEDAVALLALSSYHSCAPVNASCTSEELRQDALRLCAKAIVTTPDIHKRLKMDTFEADLGCQVFHVIPRPSGPAGLFDILLHGQKTIPTPAEPTLPQRLDDVSLILHTSGTSGKKKVVRYTLRTLLVGTWCVVQSWKLTPTDVNLNMMPLFHVGGIVRNLLAPVLSGGSTIVCSGFDPTAFWTLSTTLKATWYYAAPTVHHAVLLSRPETIDPERDTCIRLICNAAGGLLPSLALELKKTFKAIILPSYGMTECMPIATPPTDYNLDRPGCSGIACGPQISIRDPRDLEREIQDGKIGAVCVRGTPTFDGYETSADPDVPLNTSEFSSEGWFDSGDIGYLDQDGYLYITGRSKEIINKGGEVISPFEIEEAITTVAKDCVKSTLTFSIEHDVLQETIGVLIVAVPGRPRIGLAQLHDRLKGHLHPSKWPFAVVYIDDLPKNCAGKPLRISLAKRLNIEQLSDGVPSLQRHYEAILPDNAGNISTPIPCSRVTADHLALDQTLRKIEEVQDVALRTRHDGSLEAFVISKAGQTEIYDNIANIIHGYSLPSAIYVIDGHLTRSANGDFDFEAMLATWSQKSATTISDDERLVQNIFAEVLNIDPKGIRADSDFFLLGGNSLLLGKLSYHLRKRAGVNIPVVDLFTDCSVKGVSNYIKGAESPTPQLLAEDYELKMQTTRNSSTTVFEEEYDYDRDPENLRAINGRGSTNPLCLIVQAIPYLTFFPLKFALTWATLLFILSYLSMLTKGDYWHRMIALTSAIIGARFLARIICPCTAILFKWLVIWKYRPGKYKMWSSYHLRWWLVDQSLRIAGRGIFAMHPSLIVLYYRLLGAKIGSGVTIDDDARLYECDLIHLEDGCRIDSTCLRGFRLERDGYCTLAPTFIGERAVVNASTYISPGARVLPGEVYGPHASSHDPPSQKHFAAYNTTLAPKLNLWLKLFVAYPLIFLVFFISYIPWMVAIFGMISSIHMSRTGLSDIEAIISWFSDTQRILLHALSRVVHALFQPIIQTLLGILIKRLMGFNKEVDSMSPSQSVLLKRYICSVLLSRKDLKNFFSIIGTHYEGVSIIYRLMGAKVGKRIYWPGSGIICPEPELLEIGDDVVFGSRSSLITSDRLGSGKIIIEDGAMIADRVILLPGTKVGKRAVMGSGSLGKRNAIYPAGSTWMGNEKGEAICLNAGNDSAKKGDTKTPFGRAFYDKKADYFVLPYSVVLFLNVAITILSAAYWSCNAVGAARILRNVQYRKGRAGHRLFENGWYRYAILYGIIAGCFVIMVAAQGMFTVLWVIGTKWLIIGRRREGQYNWDKSSYCQRWQLHLTLSRPMYRGYGNGGVLAPFTGSAYMVWFYRALGAKIGKNCAIWAGGTLGLMTEPDLIELGDNVSLDDCSVVAHINSRGQFSLNRLKIERGSTMRSGSRLLSGAAMEERSMLCEHTLLTSGEIADCDTSYVGWPARIYEDFKDDSLNGKGLVSLTCPICRRFPKESAVTSCGHLFCHSCITKSLSIRKNCPVCCEPAKPKELTKVHLSFAIDEKTDMKY